METVSVFDRWQNGLVLELTILECYNRLNYFDQLALYSVSSLFRDIITNIWLTMLDRKKGRIPLFWREEVIARNHRFQNITKRKRNYMQILKHSRMYYKSQEEAKYFDGLIKTNNLASSNNTPIFVIHIGNRIRRITHKLKLNSDFTWEQESTKISRGCKNGRTIHGRYWRRTMKGRWCISESFLIRKEDKKIGFGPNFILFQIDTIRYPNDNLQMDPIPSFRYYFHPLVSCY